MTSTTQALQWMANLDIQGMMASMNALQTQTTQSMRSIAQTIRTSAIVPAIHVVQTALVNVADRIRQSYSTARSSPLFAFHDFMTRTPAQLQNMARQAQASMSSMGPGVVRAAADITLAIENIVNQSRAAGVSMQNTARAIDYYLNNTQIRMGRIVISAAEALETGLMMGGTSQQNLVALYNHMNNIGATASATLQRSFQNAIDVKGIRTRLTQGIVLGVAEGSIALPFILARHATRVPGIIARALSQVPDIVHRNVYIPVVRTLSHVGRAAAREMVGLVQSAGTAARHSYNAFQQFFSRIPRIFRLRVRADVDRASFVGAGNAIGHLRRHILSLGGPLFSVLGPLYLFRESLYPLANILRGVLAPAFVPIQDAIMKQILTITPYVYAVIPKLQDAFVKLIPYIAQVFNWVVDTTKAFVGLVASSGPAVSILKLLVAGIVAYQGVVLVSTALTRAWGLAMMALRASPIILIGTAIVGLIYGFRNLSQDIQQGTFSFQRLYERAMLTFQKIYDYLAPLGKRIYEIFQVYAIPVIQLTIKYVERAVYMAANVVNTVGMPAILAITGAVAGAFLVFRALGPAIAVVGAVVRGATGVFYAFSAAISGVRIALRAARIGWMLFNAAFVFSPVGMIIGIVAAIGALSYAIYRLSKGTAVWDWMRAKFSGFASAFSALTPIGNAIMALGAAIWKALTSLGGALMGVARNLMAFIIPAVGAIWKVLNGLLFIISPVIRVVSFFGGVIIRGVLIPALSIAATVIGTIVEGLSRVYAVIGGVISRIASLYDTLINKLMSSLKSLPSWAKKSLNWLFGIEIDGSAVIQPKTTATNQIQIQAAPSKPVQVVTTTGAPKMEIGIPEIPSFDFSGQPGVSFEMPEFEMPQIAVASQQKESKVEGLLATVADKADTFRVVEAINGLRSELAQKGTEIQRLELKKHDVSLSMLRRAIFS